MDKKTREEYPLEVLTLAQTYVRDHFLNEGTGHDYYHTERVVINARKLLKSEEADTFIVELAAWLHDIGDYKLHGGVDKSAELITAFLKPLGISHNTIDKVIEVVSQVSFSKGNKPTSIEAKIVQDADRLDAIGAIGIARCFAYGGSKNRLLYSPELEEQKDTSIQHFYDKLLKLKDLMNTPSAQFLAKERHDFMKEYLAELFKEIK